MTTLERVQIKEIDLKFINPISERYSTDKIVIHHTGSVQDMDASALDIHGWHKAQGYSGIGYHFVKLERTHTEKIITL